MDDDSDARAARRLPMPDWAKHNAALRAAFAASDSYALLLILLLADFFLLAALPDEHYSTLIRAPFIVATVLLALRTSDASPRLIRFARWAGVLAFVSIVLAFLNEDEWFRGLVSLIFVMLLAALPFVIIRRILGHEEVSAETIYGALCVYLLIGLVFSSLFVAVNGLGSEHFALPADQNQPADLLYLSFITLTTVGFGDVVPNTDFARAVVVLEALIGQIFLVTLVARLVAMFGQEQRRRDRGTDDEA
ncbi:MAG: ion channel [Acidimicrobiia bacterium]|nr:ion channel [Acidimicrobiia bacterium]